MSYVTTSDARQIDPESLAHEYTYSGGFIATDTVVDPISGDSYRKTYTWSGGLLVSETKWVKV